MAHKYVYLFSEGNAQMRELLGGKGANLAETVSYTHLVYHLELFAYRFQFVRFLLCDILAEQCAHGSFKRVRKG